MYSKPVITDQFASLVPNKWTPLCQFGSLDGGHAPRLPGRLWNNFSACIQAAGAEDRFIGAPSAPNTGSINIRVQSSADGVTWVNNYANSEVLTPGGQITVNCVTPGPLVRVIATCTTQARLKISVGAFQEQVPVVVRDQNSVIQSCQFSCEASCETTDETLVA